MFYIFLLQTNDSMYETTSQQSIDFDVHELLNDANISHPIESVNLTEKTLKTINVDILRLLFIIPQTDEIKSKVEALVNRS